MDAENQNASRDVELDGLKRSLTERTVLCGRWSQEGYDGLSM
jgi:hypothetical protein